MIEKKIRNFFNSIPVSSPDSCCCCGKCEDAQDDAEIMEEELEVMPDAEAEETAPTLCDYARFAAKTFLLLASVLAVGKAVALLVDLISGEDEED